MKDNIEILFNLDTYSEPSQYCFNCNNYVEEKDYYYSGGDYIYCKIFKKINEDFDLFTYIKSCSKKE